MTPDECTSLHDVRREIDRIDRDLIAMIGQRARYVEAAARFKQSEQDVSAPERRAAMMQDRRAWAAEAGLDPGLVEDLYHRLIAYFIQCELEHWRKRY